MPERPLLLFPAPQPADRENQQSRPGSVHKPSVARQGQRLAPMFKKLQEAFAARTVEIQQNTAGTEPELVIVMEIIDSVEGFVNAVQRIAGLEWLGEIERDEIAPDQDFYDEKEAKKKLLGRLYMVMSNQQALGEMLSLWRRYQADPDSQFRRGLTRFRDVFQLLQNIRRWDIQDRLIETGVIDSWKQELEDGGDRVIALEVELWFRRSDELRASGASRVTELVQQAGGRILSQSVIEGIAYHGMLAELPANAIQALVDDPNTALVKCDHVMFFRPAGQMVVGDRSPRDGVSMSQAEEISRIEEMPLPAGDPVIALFDGFPLANHSLLAGRLVVDDPDGWAADCAAADRVHGSAMASLIVHGDLNRPQPPLTRPVYVRPVMKPISWLRSPRPERIPADCLAIDLIHRAVKRLFEGEQGEGPVAPQVKVINLSVGDPSRPFTHAMSPFARLLDWLSVQYGVLFFVSAGNHLTDISLGISWQQFHALQAGELEAATIKALYRDSRNRRLLSPAETINGISVGSVHLDESPITYQGDSIDPFEQGLPSPVSAFGGGYRGAIKPDVLYSGGRQWYRQPWKENDPATIESVAFRSPPGNKAAFPGGPAVAHATAHSCGTSNATALMSRAAGICYDSLQQILSKQAKEIETSHCEVPLLKAMLVHGCAWGAMGSRISEVLQPSANGRQLKALVSRWVGYGVPQTDRVLGCTEQRATLLGFGQLAYGLAVSLEVAEGTGIAVYNEIRSRIAPAIQIQQATDR